MEISVISSLELLQIVEHIFFNKYRVLDFSDRLSSSKIFLIN